MILCSKVGGMKLLKPIDTDMSKCFASIQINLLDVEDLYSSGLPRSSTFGFPTMPFTKFMHGDIGSPKLPMGFLGLPVAILFDSRHIGRERWPSRPCFSILEEFAYVSLPRCLRNSRVSGCLSISSHSRLRGREQDLSRLDKLCHISRRS